MTTCKHTREPSPCVLVVSMLCKKVNDMKKKLKLFLPIMVVVFIIITVSFVSYLKANNWDETDQNGNIVILKNDPYYGYIEKSYWEEDYKNIIVYQQKNSYLSKENKDYTVSNYDGGICIEHFWGETSDVLQIPETIDGKPVVKLGQYLLVDQENNVFGDALAFGGDNETTQPKIKEVYIPSGVKEIVAHTFSSMGSDLEKIIVDKNNPYYYSENGNLYSRKTNKLLCAPKYDYYAESNFVISLYHYQKPRTQVPGSTLPIKN